jgi:hypothetical protein
LTILNLRQKLAVQSPTYQEKLKICKAEGITVIKKANEIAKKSHDLRSLFRNVNYHKIGIPSRYE